MYKVRKDTRKGRYVISYHSKDNKDIYWEIFNIEWYDVINFIDKATEIVKLFENESKH